VATPKDPQKIDYENLDNQEERCRSKNTFTHK